MSEASIHVVGLGARTSIGTDVPTTAAAVRAGIANFAEHPSAIDSVREPMIVAGAPYIEADVVGSDRFVELALPAALEALGPLGTLGRGSLPPVPVVIGLTPQRPGRPEDLDARIKSELSNLLEKSGPIETIATGHSAGLMALETGVGIIRRGRSDCCLIGGVDSYLDTETLRWLESCDQVHSAGLLKNAWGFVPGEAAGFCLLASWKLCERAKLPSLCELRAAATARETNLIKTDTVCIGEGLTELFRTLFAALPPGGKVEQVICDMNGEAYRADEYGFSTARTSEFFVDASDFVAPADCWGDVGAASGPLFVGLAAVAARKGYAKGPRTLVWASSESGERAGAIIEAFPPDERRMD